jgi:hypothetical protein
LQVNVTNAFFFIVFKAGLQPYLRLDTSGMARDTLIEHKKVVMIYEESGSIIANCNALIIHLESKLVPQLILTYITIKQWLTYSNCVKTSHVKKTCHNKRKEEHIVLITSTKVVELVVGVITQPIKPARVPLKYPCIICSNSKHCALDYLRKIEV